MAADSAPFLEQSDPSSVLSPKLQGTHVQVMNIIELLTHVIMYYKPPYRIPLQALTTETLTAEDTIEAITATIST